MHIPAPNPNLFASESILTVNSAQEIKISKMDKKRTVYVYNLVKDTPLLPLHLYISPHGQVCKLSEKRTFLIKTLNVNATYALLTTHETLIHIIKSIT
jgi:hypothetical protein